MKGLFVPTPIPEGGLLLKIDQCTALPRQILRREGRETLKDNLSAISKILSGVGSVGSVTDSAMHCVEMEKRLWK